MRECLWDATSDPLADDRYGAPVAVMGIILPIYTIIDMIETAENVWSDSCVCAMTGHDTEPS